MGANCPIQGIRCREESINEEKRVQMITNKMNPKAALKQTTRNGILAGLSVPNISNTDEMQTPIEHAKTESLIKSKLPPVALFVRSND